MSVPKSERRKLPNSFDVARRAQVSRTTVSYVLNGRFDLTIPESTRQRVFDAANELGYRQNKLVRGMVLGSTETLGVITPGTSEPYVAEIIDGIEQACRERGYRILLADSQRDPDEEEKQAILLLEHRVDGIVCIPAEMTVGHENKWIDSFVGSGEAIIMVDDRTYSSRVDTVVSDDVAGSMEAVRYLTRMGHRRIAHLSGGSLTSSGRDRQAGYVATLITEGMPVSEELVISTGFQVSRVPDVTNELLDLPDPPTAIFAANDIIAAEAMLVLQDRGLSIPDDISLVGYGNMPLSKYLRLTTVNQDHSGMGRTAARRLIDRIGNRDLAPGEVVARTSLVVRKSACPPRQMAKTAASSSGTDSAG